MIPDFIRQEIEGSLKSLEYEKVIVLEETENSDLLPVGKPSELEFFERLFEPGGPSWKLYEDLGLGLSPTGSYMPVVGGRMYFCMNVIDKYIYSVGMKKKYDFKGNKLVRVRPINLDNILLLLSAPLDTFKHASSTVVTAFKTNEALKNFVKFSKESRKDWRTDFDDPLLVAEESLNKALKCMEFSFLSSIAYNLKIKLADSAAWSECELGELVDLLKGGDTKAAKERFGFYANNPYAISEERFLEDESGLKRMANVPVPRNSYIRWRENSKFLAARYLAMRRFAYLGIAKESKLDDLVFFLKTSELRDAKNNKTLAEQRKKKYATYLKLDLPAQLVLVDGKLVEGESDRQIHGMPVAGEARVTGKAVLVDSRSDFTKDLDGRILVSRTLSPELVEAYDKIIAVVSASGGALAHSAVIAREMNLPCIVQTKNFEGIKEGATLEVDGKTGLINLTS
ncbi:MAG: hypothetical protein JXB14_00255 [Candidatus Altiarchaeota archaeon]|nr:hypothetical protein [Candidatus Altiarchaeota archaeon]